DSHVRGLRDHISEFLPRGCKAEACFQPGGGYETIATTHTRSPNLVNPQPHDPVVLLCGTNDVCATQWEVIQRAITDLSRMFQHCHHVCVVGVPFRFNNKKLNFHINRMNSKIKHFVKSTPNIEFIDPNKFLKPKDYARDGIHLNKSGKSKLSRKIGKSITPSQNIPVTYINDSDHAPHLSDIPSIGNNLIDLDDSTFTPNPPQPLLPGIPEFVPDSTLCQTMIQAHPLESMLDTPNFPDRVNEILLNDNDTNKFDYYKLTNWSHNFSNAVHSSPLSSTSGTHHHDPCSSKAMPIPTVSVTRPSLYEQDFPEISSIQKT
ncbi:hypothetical protein WDU94_010924, partial [Cyamophila willieti]